MPSFRTAARCAAALVCLALAGWSFVLYQSGIDQAVKTDLSAVQDKLRIYPWRAETWYILGSIHAYDLVASDPDKAIRCLLAAANLNPWDYKYWSGLSSLYAAAGDDLAAARCMDAALRLNRTLTDLHWRAANFYLRRRDFNTAARCFHRALEGDGSLLHPVLAICWRAWPDRSRILPDVIPPTAPLTMSYLQWCIQQRDATQAQRAWNRLLALPGEFTVPHSFGYIGFLLSLDRPGEAHRAWLQALQRAGRPHPVQDPPIVFNGSLEHPPLQGGFDWCTRSTPHLTLRESSSRRFHEYRSIRIEFDGQENLSGPILRQYVWIERRGAYRLDYAIMTEGLTSDQGLYFQVSQVFPKVPAQRLGKGIQHTEDSDWTLSVVPFFVATDGTLLDISLCRDESRKLEPRIKGRAWIDDIRIEAEDEP